MDIQKMIRKYQEEGLNQELASARVCQDIILKAISESTLNRNVTIKGGVVMRSLTNNSRRATKDIDLDLIHYPLHEEMIERFVERLDCLQEVKLNLVGNIEELKHQDYHGKRIYIQITDNSGYSVVSKMDIGVHKHLNIKQETYCFDVCMDEEGVSLLKNSNEQAFTEKLRSLLKFGTASRRYKDIYDMYYQCDKVDVLKIKQCLEIYVFNDLGMRENNMKDVMKRVSTTLNNSEFRTRVDNSDKKWIDDNISDIFETIVDFLEKL